jgi:hypothetical protein
MLAFGVATLAVAAALGMSRQSADPGDGTAIVRQEVTVGTPPDASRVTRVVSWTAAGRVRVDEGAARSILLDPAGARTVVLDHGSRTWRDVAPAPGPGTADPGVTHGGEPGQFAVTATGETRLVGGFPCLRYLVRRRVQLGNAAPPLARDAEVWASEEAGPAPPPRALAALLGLPLLPRGAAIERELAVIRGLPVLEVEHAALPDRVEERVTRLLEAGTGVLGAEAWEIPPGYGRAGP